MGARVCKNPYAYKNTGTTRAAYANLHVEYVPAVSFFCFAGATGHLLPGDQVDTNANDCRLRMLVHFFAQFLGVLPSFVQMTTKERMSDRFDPDLL